MLHFYSNKTPNGLYRKSNKAIECFEEVLSATQVSVPVTENIKACVPLLVATLMVRITRKLVPHFTTSDSFLINPNFWKRFTSQ